MGCNWSKKIAAQQVGSESPSDKVCPASHLKQSDPSTTLHAKELLKDSFQGEVEEEKRKEEKKIEHDLPDKAPGSAVDSTQQEFEKERTDSRILVQNEPKSIRKRRTESLKLVQYEPNPRLSNPPRHLRGEQVAAGWPIWLCSVAGEAIKGWIPRRADSFEKLDKIGQGTYSNVYKARDHETGKIVALKKVRFDNLEAESVQFMAREIEILRRLDHPNVIKLEGLVTSRMSCSLYLIFEYMEHDLSGLAACPGIMFTEAQVKCYLQQLFWGLDHCHSHNVLHRDIKGSNLLLDNGGHLKIADFGLATICHAASKQAMTSRVVTLWYRPPELLLGATEYTAAIDLWSTGCLLAELLAGRPIMPGRTEVEQLHKIFKLCGSPSEEFWKKSKLPHATIFKPQQSYKRCLSDTFKKFPASSLALLETLFSIEPSERGTAAEALQSDFFNSKPLPCDPSILPQYPPSKELNAKQRAEGAQRHRVAAGKGIGLEAGQHQNTKQQTKIQNTKQPSIDGLAVLESRTKFQDRSQKQRAHSQLLINKVGKFSPHKETDIEPPIVYPSSKSHSRLPRSQTGFPHASSKSGPVAGPSWKKLKDDEICLVSMPITATVSIKDPGKQPKREASGKTTRKYRSEALMKKSEGRPQNPEQDKTSKSLSVVNSYSKMTTLKDRRSKEGQAAHGFRSQAERIFHSGPLVRPGIEYAADVEELSDEHELKMRRAARRAAQIAKEFKSIVGVTEMRKQSKNSNPS